MGLFLSQLKGWLWMWLCFLLQLKGGYGWGHFLVVTKRVALDGVIF